MACGSCNKQSNVVSPSPIQVVKNGVVGLTKVALGVDKGSDSLIKERRDKCRECEHSTKNKAKINTPTKGLTNFSICELCKCNIKAKTKLASEKCPKELW